MALSDQDAIRMAGRKNRLLIARDKLLVKDTLTEAEQAKLAGIEAGLTRINNGELEIPPTGNPIGVDIRIGD